MVEDREWFEELSMPALLRAARQGYGAAVRTALAEAGYDDLPANGSYVLSGVARTGAPLADIIKGLGASKQAVGQLVDTLAVRGYLDRAIDPEDRRRLTLSLTERGRAAASVIRNAVDQVDADLINRVGAEFVEHTRATLAALIASHTRDDSDASER
jgi:DNA-binding MarR family transcriptional regulator